MTLARIGAVFDAGGTTIAVLGTAINHLYPVSNLGLAKRILEKGAIISEYPPDYPTKAYYFQVRNRIVSGLADALLVVEASENSGTYGTYNFANEQGKDIFAVPGDINRPMSRGTNMMLREGAHPYLDPSDIYISLFGKIPQIAGRDLSDLTKNEAKIFAAIVNGFRSDDEIIKALSMSLSDFATAMTMLELKGYIARRGAKWSVI